VLSRPPGFTERGDVPLDEDVCLLFVRLLLDGHDRIAERVDVDVPPGSEIAAHLGGVRVGDSRLGRARIFVRLLLDGRDRIAERVDVDVPPGSEIAAHLGGVRVDGSRLGRVRIADDDVPPGSKIAAHLGGVRVDDSRLGRARIAEGHLGDNQDELREADGPGRKQ
jgi:hypothetical protein